MNTGLEPGEAVVKEGRANLQRGAETVGGRLCLTDRRLIFESHKLNIQRGTTTVALSDVERVSKQWTRFLGALPLVPNSLAVHTTTGEEYRFVLPKREAWMTAIDKQRRAQDTQPG